MIYVRFAMYGALAVTALCCYLNSIENPSEEEGIKSFVMGAIITTVIILFATQP